MSPRLRSAGSERRSPTGWTVLALLLVALSIGALSFDPRRWPSVVGDEATYLMAAQSMAWDGDLVYTRADLERFRRLLGREPEGLILQRRSSATDDVVSPDASDRAAGGRGVSRGESRRDRVARENGAILRYAKPVFYPLAIAPLVRVLPRRGPAVANVLILIVASVAASLALERRVGPAAPLWVACSVFASVAFAHVFWAHADLMLMGLVAVSLSLVVLARERATGERGAVGESHPAGPASAHAFASEGRSAGRSGWRVVGRSAWSWFRREEGALMVAGGLAGVVAISRPLYLAVAVPLLVVAGSRPRRVRVALGLGIVLAVSLAGNLAVRGTWSSYAGERHGYYSYTGFPLADGEGAEAAAVEGAVGPSASWTRRLVPFGFDLRVTAWNLLYLWLGRHVGLLPYFLPLVLGFAAWRPTSTSWALLGALAAVALAFLVLRPFNFWGGGGALANRYLLPVYPCFWFLAQRRRGALPVVAVALLAAPFLWPTWIAPRSFFRAEDGGYRHVSAAAERLLPYETTQNQLKPSGRDDFVHRATDETTGGAHGGGLWIKPLAPGVRARGEEGLELEIGAAGAGILVGSPEPIGGLELRIVEGTREGADAGVAITAPAELGWRRVHPMWWTKEPYFLYPVDVEAALRHTPISFGTSETVVVRLVVSGP